MITCHKVTGFPDKSATPPPPRVTCTPAPTPSTGDGWLRDAGMTHLTDVTARHATDRLADWQAPLRAENKSPGTVAIYADGATRYLQRPDALFAESGWPPDSSGP